MNALLRVLSACAAFGVLAIPAAAQPREPFHVEVVPRLPAPPGPEVTEAPPPPLQVWAVQPRGWLGIASEGVPSGSTEVVRVVDVHPDSPAQQAGIQKGDTIVRIDNRAATSEMMRLLSVAPGDTVRLRIRRGGREQVKVLVAGARPARLREPIVFGRGEVLSPGGSVIVVEGDSVRTIRIPLEAFRVRADSLHQRLRMFFADSLRRELREAELSFRAMQPELRRNAERLRVQADSMATTLTRERMFAPALPRGVAGAEFTELTPELAGYFQGAREGVLVLRVAPETPAARAGLVAGDVVVRAGDTATPDLRTLSRAVSAARSAELPLEVVRKGKVQQLTLRWER